MSEAEIEVIHRGGLLHDVGKIGIDEAILNKNGRLTAEEFDEIKKHPVYGAEILRPVGFPPWRARHRSAAPREDGR